MTDEQGDRWALRKCVRDPIPEIFCAAELLAGAADAHLAGDRATASDLIKRANIGAIEDWVAPLLGNEKQYPERAAFVRFRPSISSPPVLSKAQRSRARMPSPDTQAALIRVYGHYCVFCGIPLIRAEVRAKFGAEYPQLVPWGANSHAAFLAMWLQFDHVLPHSRGGSNSPANIVVTCSGCNYGRMSYTLEEIGVMDPRTREISKGDWEGLERVLSKEEPLAMVGAAEATQGPSHPSLGQLRTHIRSRPLDPDAAKTWPWLAKVHQGDFAAVPIGIRWDESAGLAHLIDGYELAGSTEALQRLANEQLEKAECSGVWAGTPLQLWLCLFAEHRRATHSGMGPSENGLPLYDDLCRTLRRSLVDN